MVCFSVFLSKLKRNVAVYLYIYKLKYHLKKKIAVLIPVSQSPSIYLLIGTLEASPKKNHSLLVNPLSLLHAYRQYNFVPILKVTPFIDRNIYIYILAVLFVFNCFI